MTLLLICIVVLAAGTLLPLLFHRTWHVAHALGAGAAIVASLLGATAALVILGSPAHSVAFLSSFPVLGAWSIRLDATSGVFLLVTFLVSGPAAVFATGYLADYAHGRLALWLWPCFNLMVAAIVVVLMANSVLLFLLGWEVLTLASFMLVIVEHTRLEARKAAWLYLLASHAGTAFLIAFFALNSDVATLLTVSAARPWLVLLPLVGFGIKAGLVPLHVWLPEAHPAAPSHVSAVMSGAMVAVGIYGLFRTLGSVEPSYGLATIVILLGAITAVAGAIQAVAAGRVKQLLAYSTVENSGIMMLGMGAAILAAATGHRDIAYIASVSVLAHILAHGVFKSALFLAAGSIQHAAGTGDFNVLSGLGRRLPVTSVAVFAASVTAIAAPPGAAFISEFLLYLAAIRFLAVAPAEVAWLAVVLLVSLALSGACAVAAFVKLYGVPFLGRSADVTSRKHEEWLGARVALLFLAGVCLLLGVIPWLLVTPAQLALQQLGNDHGAAAILSDPLSWLGRVNSVLILVTFGTGGLLALARRRFGMRRARTWNCGFAQPVPRAQYTGTSLVEPILRIFQPKWGVTATSAGATQTASSRDPFMRGVYRPVSYMIGVGAAKVRRIQHGQLHWYLLYIFAALAGALLIEFWIGA